jgi:hypothetical protein
MHDPPLALPSSSRDIRCQKLRLFDDQEGRRFLLIGWVSVLALSEAEWVRPDSCSIRHRL